MEANLCSIGDPQFLEASMSRKSAIVARRMLTVQNSTHVMKYWRKEEDPNSHLPKNFISGFLEVSQSGER